jgi:hypothetical protein
MHAVIHICVSASFSSGGESVQVFFIEYLFALALKIQLPRERQVP